LYFYPKANTPGCTAQASAFRDSIETIRGAGADVYGISTDTVADQAAPASAQLAAVVAERFDPLPQQPRLQYPGSSTGKCLFQRRNKDG
jgi:hypothetical protein